MAHIGCEDCPLQGRPMVAPEGDPTTCKYVLIGEAPGYDEARMKRPFVGKAGKILARLMEAKRIDREDCFITNAVKCHPPKNKLPKGAIEACRPILMAELRQVPPDRPWLVLGRSARDALFPGKFKKGVIAHRGWHRWKNCRDVLCTVHPAYVMYNPANMPMLLKDLRRYQKGKQEMMDVEYVLIDSLQLLAKLGKLLREKYEGEYVSFDLETEQVNFQRDRILCIGIGVGGEKAFIIPDTLIYADGLETSAGDLHTKEPNQKTLSLLEAVFALPVKWVAHNGRFDMRFLWGQLGLENARIDFDTLLAHYALDERKGTHGLKGLADEHFDTGRYDDELLQYISTKNANFAAIPRDILYEYCAVDVEITQRLAGIFEGQLRRQGLYDRPFLAPLMSANPLLLSMEVNGIQIDWESQAQLAADLQIAVAESVEILRDISDHPELNPLSPKQVNNILYDEMGFPIIEVRTRAAGKRIKKRSGQAAVLDGWAALWKQGQLPVDPEDYRFVEELRRYRHLRKMQGSYVDKWPNFRGTDDRVHPSYLLFGTVTGRLSVKDPPVQTIPSKVSERWGNGVARMHIARPGYKLLYADYSQGELMIAACLSNDQFMLDAFKKGADYHREVALAAFGKKYTDDERTTCKRLTFGWLFGGNVYEIAMQALQFTGAVARRFAEEWDKTFAGVLRWRKRQGDLMEQQGFVESLTGRRRRFPLITKENRGKARRVAANAPIQGLLSDFNLESALRLHKMGHQVILLVHDALILEVLEEDVATVAPIMNQTMKAVAAEYFDQIEFGADVKVGDNIVDLVDIDKYLKEL